MFCTRGLHALRLVEVTIWRLFGRLSQGDYTSSGRLVLGFDFFRGMTFIGMSLLRSDIPYYGDVVAALDIVRRGGISYALLDFFLLSYWDVVAALDIPRSRGD